MNTHGFRAFPGTSTATPARDSAVKASMGHRFLLLRPPTIRTQANESPYRFASRQSYQPAKRKLSKIVQNWEKSSSPGPVVGNLEINTGGLVFQTDHDPMDAIPACPRSEPRWWLPANPAASGFSKIGRAHV